MKVLKMFLLVFLGFFGFLGFSGCSCSDASAHECKFVVDSSSNYNCVNGGEVRHKCSCGESYTEEFSSRAHEFNSDNICENCLTSLPKTAGLEFSLLANGNYEVSAYSGSEKNVVIPYYFNNKSVEKIGDNAFLNCDLHSLTLSDNIKTIGSDAVLNNNNLKIINYEGLKEDFFGMTLLSSSSSLLSQNAKFFEGKNEVLLEDLLEEVSFINSYVLSGVDFKEKLVLPCSISRLNVDAFYGTKYDKVVYEGNFAKYNQIVFLGESASPLYGKNVSLYFNDTLFNGEIDLEGRLNDYVLSGFNGETLSIKNVTQIGDYALSNLTNLTRVSFDNSLNKIGKGLFSNCEKLNNIVLPSSVSEIASFAFSGVKGNVDLSNIDKISVLEEGTFSGFNGGDIILGESFTNLYDGAFSNITKAENVIIKGKVSLGKDLFKNSKIGSLHLDGDVSFIDDNAFCGEINSVYYVGSLKEWFSIPRFGDAFIGTQVAGSNTQSFYCQEEQVSGVVKIDFDVPNYGFAGLKAITGLEFVESSTSEDGFIVGDYAFFDSGLEGEILIDNVQSIGYNAFQNSENLTKVTLKSGALSSGAFFDCVNLSEFTIECPQSTSYENVFGENTKITKAEAIVSALNVIKSQNLVSLKVISFSDSDNLNLSFSDATNLRELECDGIENIGVEVFSGSKRLSRVTLNNTTNIGNGAFSDCFNIYSLELLGQDLTYIGTNAFLNCYKLIEIKNDTNLVLSEGADNLGSVAKYAKNIYSNAHGSSKLTINDGFVFFEDEVASYLVAEAGMVEELPTSFNGESYLVYDYAFYNCENISELTLDGLIGRVGNYAFSGCENLTKVSVVGEIEFVGTQAFSNCSEGLIIEVKSGLDTSSWGESWHGGHTVTTKEI